MEKGVQEETILTVLEEEEGEVETTPTDQSVKFVAD